MAIKVNEHAEEDSYPLTRGPDQLIRVNLLQYLWRNVTGRIIHPSVPHDVSCVADVGTATGLWLCELSESRPDIDVFHGFDVSPASFIPEEDLPRRVELCAMDAAKPVPEAMRGKYDLVHLRLLQPVVTDNDPSWLIEHCKELLRPGGYLQWEEFDPMKIKIHVGAGVERPSKLEKLGVKLQTREPQGWVAALPDTLEEHDMSTVAVERKREQPWHHLSLTWLMCHVFEEFATAFLDTQGPPGAGDEMRELVKGVFEEAMRGSYTSYMFQTVVAKKNA